RSVRRHREARDGRNVLGIRHDLSQRGRRRGRNEFHPAVRGQQQTERRLAPAQASLGTKVAPAGRELTPPGWQSCRIVASSPARAGDVLSPTVCRAAGDVPPGRRDLLHSEFLEPAEERTPRNPEYPGGFGLVPIGPSQGLDERLPLAGKFGG